MWSQYRLWFRALKAAPRGQNLVKLSRLTYKKARSDRLQLLREEAWENLQKVAGLNSGRDFWAIINAPFLTEENKITLEPHVEEEAWVEHFEALFGNPGQVTVASVSSSFYHHGDSLSFTLDKIKLAHKHSKRSKAPRPDGVPIDFFLNNQDLWAPLHTNVFNIITRTGPLASWKKSVTIRIFKKGDKASPINYRPTSLLDMTAKLMGRALLNRLEEWALEKNILIHSQWLQKGKGNDRSVPQIEHDNCEVCSG